MIKLIKHRGVHNTQIRENTYEAIKMALESDKYIGCEFDVRETKDHEFIINHDPLYDGKLIENLNYNDLPKYMPRLRDILNINSNKMFLIEVKDIKSFPKFTKLLNKYAKRKIYVMSFSNNLINKINKENKTYKVGILNYLLNTEGNHKYDFIAILNSLLNDNIINTLKDKEIFSYGLLEKHKYEDVFYITDN